MLGIPGSESIVEVLRRRRIPARQRTQPVTGRGHYATTAHKGEEELLRAVQKQEGQGAKPENVQGSVGELDADTSLSWPGQGRDGESEESGAGKESRIGKSEEPRTVDSKVAFFTSPGRTTSPYSKSCHERSVHTTAYIDRIVAPATKN